MEHQGCIYIFMLINIFFISAGIGSQPLNNSTEGILSIEAKGLLSSSIDLSISGTRFNDLNSNGIKDEDEKGLAGTKIRLMQNGTEISTVITNEYGHYSFCNLSPGEYTIIEEKVNGWNQTSPPGGSYDITLADASIQNLNFGDTGGIFTDGPYEMMYFSPEEIQQGQKIHASLPKVSISPAIMMQTRRAAGEHFSLLNYLPYNPAERYQGSCGNCWVWAGTALIEVDNNVRNSISERLSIQYFSSNYNGGAGCDFNCCGGWPFQVADFYNERKKVIPWENDKAHPFEDRIRCCSLACNPAGCDPGTTVVAASDIAEYPNYRIDSINCQRVNTIDEIKTLLKQKKAVTFTFWQNSRVAFDDYWRNRGESDVFNPGTWGGRVGHAVACVGYDDTDPSNPYWIMLNSWGAQGNRPNGLFAVTMNLDYNDSWKCQFNTFDINWRDDLVTTNIVALQTHNGHYLCAEGGGGEDVVANRNAIGGWETFKLLDLGNNMVALQAYNGQYLSAEGGGGNGVVANRDWISDWETFRLIDRGNGYYALQANNGQYLCAEGGGGNGVVANRDWISDWETFRLIDLRRPARVALQASNGQYLCAEGGGGNGVVANRDWISDWETFNLIDQGNGNVAFQAFNGQYLCAEGSGGGDIVANRIAISAWETFRLIYMANNNVAIQVFNHQYACADGGGGDGVVANRDWILDWETFKLIPR